MSRLVGLIGFQGLPPEDCQRLAHQMLTVLPGDRDAMVAAGGAGTFGWRSWAGRGGGIAAGEDGCVLVIDGQLYNPEVLVEVPGADEAARVLWLCRSRGFAATLERLTGDYALAFYDAERMTLWLGRDRLGVKPLYYTSYTGGIAFASQPRALLRLPGVSPTPNRRYAALIAASHYRSFDTDPESSPYQEIAQLPAATVVAVTPAGIRRERYWELAKVAAVPVNGSEDELAEQYRTLLFDAVKRRLAVAGRAAFTVSGGMDSSSVLCSAVTVSGRPQVAWSSVYEDRTYDERDDIRDLLDGRIESWHPVEVGNDIDLLGLVSRLVAVHDEPVATATWLSHALLCDQVAAAGFSSLFGGLGGDELNAGEYEYFPFHFADLRAAGAESALAHEIACWAHHHDHPIWRKDAAVAEAMIAARTDPALPGQCRPDGERLGRYFYLLDPDWDDLTTFAPPMDRPFSSYLKNRAWHDLARETTPCCLRAEDRQCTAAGLVHYDPFLDQRLVEFMFQVPGSLKIRDGVTKVLLRRAMAGILPEATRQRVKKTGWNAPAHRWFGGPFLATLRDIVASQRFRAYGIYRIEAVQQLIDDHERIVSSGTNEENHMMFLWQLLNLHLWLTELDKPPASV